MVAETVKRARAKGHEEPCATVQRLDERLRAVEAHTGRQNGFIEDLRVREIPSLRAEIGGLRESMDDKLERLYDKLDERAIKAEAHEEKREEIRVSRRFKIVLTVIGAAFALFNSIVAIVVTFLLQHIRFGT